MSPENKTFFEAKLQVLGPIGRAFGDLLNKAASFKGKLRG